MTETDMDLSELLATQNGGDFLRGVAEAVPRPIVEADGDGPIGAGRHERADPHTTWGNGYRERAPDTRLGTLNLKVPKLRQGSYVPGFPEPRKTSETALLAFIQEAWIGDVSPRKVDDLVQAMGVSDISKSTVTKLCGDIDERGSAFLDRPLTGDWPYIRLDATYPETHQGGRNRLDGRDTRCRNQERRAEREIVGLGLGPSGAETFWIDLPRGLKARGLDGTKLAIGAAHGGLKNAIERVCDGSLQRCRGHWMRPALAHVSRGRHSVVAAGEMWRKVAEACGTDGHRRT